ncbi:MAG: GGDEF domain-containing protein [Schwartzia sp.]|nr:GGDEF domain-containing protein [Schwartzia sp. (in: firmicutes)]
MNDKKRSLLFKFGLIFTIFTVIAVALGGLATYYSQMESYRRQCERNIRDIGAYLERLILQDQDNFAIYQRYYMAHFAEVDIPFDINNYRAAQAEYEKLFAMHHSGRTFGVDIEFDDMDPEVQKAWFIYYHEYWLLTFEEARVAFNIPYTYYLVPKEEIFNMVYMIDGERTAKKDSDGKILYLGDEYNDPIEKYPVQWEAWFTGRKLDKSQVWDNEWGHTYAYYTPLIINGKKLGLIGTEVEVKTVNEGILDNTLKQIAGVGAIVILCVLVLLWYINRRYISKIVRLGENIKKYAEVKDAEIAGTIEKDATGGDELAALSMQASAMILELENYMKSLVDTTKRLGEAQEKADAMSEMVNKDALTGIRNKTAYDKEIRRVEWEMQGHDGKEFGIAMIDLNFLKRINDTYGHEQGNIAIKKLCHMVCTIFDHSPVFRIGGDEFAVVLENNDYKNVDALVAQFNAKIEEMAQDATLEPWERISAAIGVAYYDPVTDSSAANVFKRADKAMYIRKKEMKAVRTE